MKFLSKLLPLVFIIGIKSSAALFECHPHKAVCDKNCELRYNGGLNLLVKICKAACTVSQCLVKSGAIPDTGKNGVAIQNTTINNMSLRSGKVTNKIQLDQKEVLTTKYEQPPLQQPK